MNLTERKLKVAQENREEFMTHIERILSSMNTSMTLKEAMNVFLSVRVKTPENLTSFICAGCQKLDLEAGKMVKKASIRNFMSASAMNQRPSSMR